MKRATLAATLALTVGCAPATEQAPPAQPPAQSNRGCDAASSQRLIGQPASEALAADAQRWSGARNVRWLRPGQMVTMEYRADRLNIEVDSQNRVIAIRCG